MKITATNELFLTIKIYPDDFVKIIESKLIKVTPEVVQAATWGRRCRLVDTASGMSIYYYLHSVIHADSGDYGYWVKRLEANYTQTKVEVGYYN